MTQYKAKYLWLIMLMSTTAYAAAPGVTPGEFSVDASGSANYQVPIAVPPGTAGMQPSLTLSYNSRSGNGLLGMGWTLGGLSVITRCPATNVIDGEIDGIDFDDKDRFCIDGQRLIQVTGSAGDYGKHDIEYRTEIDGYTKIITKDTITTNNGPESFIAYTKSGQVLEYGNTADSRIESVDATSGTITTDDNIRIWAVNKISDTVGNYLTMTYSEDSTNGTYQPTQMDYTGNANSNPVLTPNTSIKFEYATRTDTPALYFSGKLVKNTERLTNIKTYTGITLVRDYQLTYDNNGTANRSRLTQLTECDGLTTQSCFKSTGFEWQDGNGIAADETLRTTVATSNWFSGYEIYPGDYNSDGVTDLIMAGGNTSYFCAAPDFIVTGNPINDCIQIAANAGWKDGYHIYPGDYDGDGVTDLIMAGGNTSYFCPSSGLTVHNTGTLPTNCIQIAANAGWFSGYHIYPSDYDGDGVTDLIMAGGNTSYFCPSSGLTVHNTSTLPTNCIQIAANAGWKDGYHIYPGDYDGDGVTDLMMGGGNTSYFCPSSGLMVHNTGLLPTNCIQVAANAGWKYGYHIYPGDYNGDGQADLMMAGGTTSLFIPGGELAPDIVTKIRSSLNTETTITYSPITNSTIYTKGTGAQYPVVDIQGAVYVVSKVTVDDGIGGTRDTDYTYKGAKSSLNGRGFLGFKTMTATDSATGIKTTTTYAQTHPYIGLVERTEQRLSDVDETLLGEVDTTFGETQTHTGVEVTTGHPGVLFPYAATVTKKDYELAVTP